MGPGSYEVKDQYKSIAGGHVYRPIIGNKDVKNNGYYFIGYHLVYDPAFSASKAHRKSVDLKQDLKSVFSDGKASENRLKKAESTFCKSEMSGIKAKRPNSASRIIANRRTDRNRPLYIY